MPINETMSAILDVAQELLQTRGYNAFSIKDLADRVEIRTSSIHYYFATKADLCRALISRHRQRVAAVLAGIDRAGRRSGNEARTIRLPVPEHDRGREPDVSLRDVRRRVRDPGTGELHGAAGLFRRPRNLAEASPPRGEEGRSLAFSGSALQEARLILSTLEGAMLVARTYEDPARFRAVARRLLDKLKR